MLGIERVGIHDDFFRLGGHSLAAIRVASKVGAELSCMLSVSDLFQATTVARLAESVRKNGPNSKGSQQESIARTPRDHTLELSHSQERLWFLQRFEEGRKAYDAPFGYRLSGPVDAAILEQCFDELIRRHEVLRTTYREQDGRACQQVQAPGSSICRRAICASA